MKNFIMTMASAAVILFATEVTAQEDKDMAMTTQDGVEAPMQDAFQEIESADLPDAVQEAVSIDFESATIASAYEDVQNQVYKLVLEIEGMEAKTIYANEDGEWIKPKE